MDNNKAIVCKLGNLTKIEGADKIVKADVILNEISLTSVVVGVDTIENTPVVYFDSNMMIEQNIIDYIDKLSPDYGKEGFKTLGNYLSKGNRVRCIKLKNTLSNGLAIGIEKFYQFSSIGANDPIFKEGSSFTQIGDIDICKKWLPTFNNSTFSKGKKDHKGTKSSRIIPTMFHFHIDTAQLKLNLHKITPETVLSISRKIHGTSAICAYTKVLKTLTIVEKICKFLKIPIVETEYDYIYASRSVVKNDAQSLGFYKVDLWSQVGKEQFFNKLHKNECVYYEIVGYLPNTSSFIQKHFDYGCKIGEYKIAVYRITTTNEDGVVTEYSWQAMKERCKELCVPTVEEYFFGYARDIVGKGIVETDWRTRFIEYLKQVYLEKYCLDNLTRKIPDEGIVLKIEGLYEEAYKLKSENFYLFESSAKEDETTIDTEEQESIGGTL